MKKALKSTISRLLTSFGTLPSGERGTTFELFYGGFEGNREILKYVFYYKKQYKIS